MLGAGLMGAGIAMVTAQAGIEVVLLDRDLAAADKGKQYTADRLAKKRMAPGQGAGHPRPHQADRRLSPTSPVCDLIIEAVFETREIKADVTKATEAVVGPDVIFGSNTSTLPITGLAKAWSQARRTSSASTSSRRSRRCRWSRSSSARKPAPKRSPRRWIMSPQIRKTPIVVNDSRGFYTSRCFGTYVQEGLSLLGEGITPGADREYRQADGHARRPAGGERRSRPRPQLQGRSADQGRPGRRLQARPGRWRHRQDARARPPGPQERQGLLRLPGRRQEVPLAGTRRRPSPAALPPTSRPRPR